MAIASQGNSHREKNGDFSRKHGNALICTLRQTYGAGFAPGRSGDQKLSDVLHDLDEPSLTYAAMLLRITVGVTLLNRGPKRSSAWPEGRCTT